MTATPSGLDMALTCNKDVARFFALPIELRDKIYDFCYQEEQQRQEQCGRITRPATMLYNIRAPIPQLRLVNQQVKAEYDKRWPLNSTLDFSVDEYNPALEFFEPLPRLPRLAAMSTTVNVGLKLHRYIGAHYDLPRHLTVLDFIPAALPNLVEDLLHLKRLEVSLYFEYQTCHWVQKVIRSFGKVDTMFGDVKADYPRLAKLVKLNAVWSELDGNKNVRLPTWTPGDGLNYDKGALEARLKNCSRYDRCTRKGHRAFDEPM